MKAGCEGHAPILLDLNVLSMSSAAMGVTSEAATGTTVSGDSIGASIVYMGCCSVTRMEMVTVHAIESSGFLYRCGGAVGAGRSGVGCSRYARYRRTMRPTLLTIILRSQEESLKCAPS